MQNAALSTDKQAHDASPRDREYLLDASGGLFLRVRPDGAKSWIRRYTIQSKQTKLGLGAFPEVNLQAARDASSKISQMLDAGRDPRARKMQARVEARKLKLDKFEKIAREWHRHATIANEWGEDYTLRVLRMLELHVFPRLGKYPIALIHQSEVFECLKVTALSGRNPRRETAVRIREKIAAVYRYAVTMGILEPSSNFMAKGVAEFKIPSPRVRHFAAFTDPRKVGQLLRDIRGYQGHYVVRCAMEIMPYLFQRPGQTRLMQWEQLDLEAGTWTCPPSIMKMRTADKQDDRTPDHIVPMPSQVVAILRDLRDFTGPSGPVFKSVARRNDDTRYISENTINAALRALGYDTQRDITAHGFRAMARTMLRERLGWDREVIERHMAHVSDEELGDTYDRASFLQQREEMIQAWADYLDKLAATPASKAA